MGMQFISTLNSKWNEMDANGENRFCDLFYYWLQSYATRLRHNTIACVDVSRWMIDDHHQIMMMTMENILFYVISSSTACSHNKCAVCEFKNEQRKGRNCATFENAHASPLLRRRRRRPWQSECNAISRCEFDRRACRISRPNKNGCRRRLCECVLSSIESQLYVWSSPAAAALPLLPFDTAQYSCD